MKMETSDIEEKLSEMRDWKLEDRSITKEFPVDGLVKGAEFVREIAYMAENMNQKPDILLRPGYVKFSLTTREEGGVTEKDFDFAGKIEKIYTKITMSEEAADEGDYGITEDSDNFDDYDSDDDGDGD